jgi:dTDP-L-rhamnose 4-epimerase
MKNILITGGAGFIGSNLSLALLQKGYTITVVDNLSPQIHGQDPEFNSVLFNSIKGKVKFIKKDITQRETWEEVIPGHDAIIHLAAETGTGQSMYQIERYVNGNIGGTALLLDILTNSPHQVKKVIIASSRAIYGEGKYESTELGYVYPAARTTENMQKGHFEVTHPGCKEPLKLVATDELSQIAPTSIYGITKQTQEQMIMVSCKSIGIAAVAFRYQNVYGPGQSLSNPYTGILSIFSTLIKNGQAINIFEDGNESRDFVYIDDVIAATILGLEKDEANGEVFNVGSGIPTKVIEVARELVSNYGVEVPIKISGNFRLGDIRHNFADLSKIKQKLGFVPQVDFKEGIRRFAGWVNSQKLEVSQFEKSIEELESKGLFGKS